MLHRSLAHTFHDKENTYHLPSRTPLRIGLAGSSFATAGARTVGRPNVKTPFTKTHILPGEGKPPQTTRTGKGKEKIWIEGGINLGELKAGDGKDGQIIEPRRLFTLQTNRGSPKTSGTFQLNASSKEGTSVKPNSNQPPPTLKKSRPAPTPQHVLRTPHPTQKSAPSQSHSPTQQLANVLSTPLPSTNRTRRRSKLHTPLSSSTSSNNLSRSLNKSSNFLAPQSPLIQMDPGFSTPAARMKYPVVDFEIDDPDVIGTGSGLGELVEENVLEVEEEDDEIEEMNRGSVDEPFELPYDTLDMTDLGQRVRNTAMFLEDSSSFSLPPPVDIILDDHDHDGSLNLRLKDFDSDEELYALLDQPRYLVSPKTSSRANSDSRDSRSTRVDFSTLPPSVSSISKRIIPTSASRHLHTAPLTASNPSVSRRPLSSASTSSRPSTMTAVKMPNRSSPPVRQRPAIPSSMMSTSSASSRAVGSGTPSALRQNRTISRQTGAGIVSAEVSGKNKWAALQARDHRLGRELLAGLVVESDQDQTRDDLFAGFEL